MVGSEEIKLHIEKIISSKSFGNSTTYANLLRYLARCTSDNNVPKETTIASEIFAKKDFDPSQSTLIRVYVYNLRKKIITFYQNEGQNEAYHIQIPKGGYALEFVKKRHDIVEKAAPLRTMLYVFGGLLLVSLVFNLYLASSNNKRPLIDQNGLWKDLVASKRPKTLVMGDLFIYNEIDTLRNLIRTVRGPSINSLQEFEAFKAGDFNEDVEITPLNYTHLILGSTQWVKKLSEIFYSIDDNYSIRTMSRFNPKQLQDSDLLVVGMHKTLGVFKNFYDNSAFEYDTENDAFHFTKNTEVITYRPSGDADNYHTDYALMAKVPGSNNNSVYLFSGIWDTGATQSLKNFTDQDLLAEIEQKMKDKFGTLPKYYEVFFEVNGIDRTELSSTILYMSAL